MAVEDFTRMVLREKAQTLAAAIARLVSQLPRDRVAGVIGTQLVRAAGSVPANIAEGYGRFSQPAYRNHLSIARGSLFETESWLDLLHRTGCLSDETRRALHADCQEVGRMLTQKMKSLGAAKLTYAREEASVYADD